MPTEHIQNLLLDRDHLGRSLLATDHRLLLTATPFQLDMTELHGPTKHLVEGKATAHKVLKRGAGREYAKLADATFEDKNLEPPTKPQRRDAQRVLGQLLACSQVGRQKRRYFAINADGEAEAVPPPTDLDKQDGFKAVFDHAVPARDRRLRLLRPTGEARVL
jgi:hypothetical protein